MRVRRVRISKTQTTPALYVGGIALPWLPLILASGFFGFGFLSSDIIKRTRIADHGRITSARITKMHLDHGSMKYTYRINGKVYRSQGGPSWVVDLDALEVGDETEIAYDPASPEDHVLGAPAKAVRDAWVTLILTGGTSLLFAVAGIVVATRSLRRGALGEPNGV